MPSFDPQAFASALSHAGSLSDDVRDELTGFVARAQDLRAPFGAALDTVAKAHDASFSRGETLGEGLGGSPDDAAAFKKRLADVRDDLGDKIIDEALIRLGYAEGAPLARDGSSVNFGPPLSSADKNKALTPGDVSADTDSTSSALSLKEALAAGEAGLEYSTISALAKPMERAEVFNAYAQRVVAYLHDEGHGLTKDGAWIDGDGDGDPKTQADRLTTIALADTDEAGALRRATGKLVPKEKRLAFTIEAIYDNGMGLTDGGEVV